MFHRFLVQRLVRHTLVAATLWIVVAGAVEYVIPHSVTPFVNLPGFALVLLAGQLLYLLCCPADQNLPLNQTKLSAGAAFLVVISDGFLILKINDGTRLGLGLSFLSIMVTGAAFFFLSSRDSSLRSE